LLWLQGRASFAKPALRSHTVAQNFRTKMLLWLVQGSKKSLRPLRRNVFFFICLRSSEGPSPQSAHGRPKTSPRRPTTRPKCYKYVTIPLRDNPKHPKAPQDLPNAAQYLHKTPQDVPKIPQSLCLTCPESSPRTLSRCVARSLSRCAPKSLGGAREAKMISPHVMVRAALPVACSGQIQHDRLEIDECQTCR
jgi:hypothetical protein